MIEYENLNLDYKYIDDQRSHKIIKWLKLREANVEFKKFKITECKEKLFNFFTPLESQY